MTLHHARNPAIALVLSGLILLPAARTAGQMRVGIQPDGSVSVPTHQILRPAGRQVLLRGRPVDLDLSPDGKWLVVKNSKSFELIRTSDLALVQTLSIPAGASFTGIEFSPDGRTIYATDEMKSIHVARMDDADILHWSGTIPVPAPETGGNPVPTGLSFDGEKGFVYVTSSRGNCIWKIRLSDGQAWSIPVGVAPYDLVLASPAMAYVTNWGGRRPLPGQPMYASSGTSVRVDGTTGVADSGTVSVVDLALGREVAEIDVGLHPSGLVLSPDKRRLYVACANSDIVSVIDTARNAVVEEINVRLRKGLPFGSGPNALAVSPDGSRLYVANGTDNAVCVVAAGPPGRVVGFIPTGWYPGSVAMDADGKRLYVANVKGIGSLSRAKEANGRSVLDFLGSVSVIDVPSDGELAGMTRVVEANNSLDILLKNLADAHTGAAVPSRPSAGQVPSFTHVIYIIRENRTYDQVLGDVVAGDGDPTLVMFGRDVTPNAHALAERFGLLDNYYCSGALSADGHQWTDEAYVTDYIEKFFGDFTRSYPFSGGDPLAYAGSGFIWDNALRHGLTFRDYGEFTATTLAPPHAKYADLFSDYQKGTSVVGIRAKATLDQIEPYVCPTYAGFNLAVPDVLRASTFVSELRQFEQTGSMPNFIIMLLPGDHTAGTSPGYPTPASSVADNDLALGRIIEAVTHSVFWKDTCVFVTEDDPQAGLDHVDGHRTVGLVISPYSRKGAVISAPYSQINMVRTIEAVLGLPPMNQLDLGASPMAECFGQVADLTPFHALPNRVPLNRLNPPLPALRGQAAFWARKSLEQDLSDVDRIDEDVFNRIIWHAVKGYDTPYPGAGTAPAED
jgi:YVTN family beta-propeller protein